MAEILVGLRLDTQQPRQALASSGATFLPLFVTSGADTSNRTDLYIAFGP